MNIFYKTKRYLHLRNLGLNHKAAKGEFKHPLVEFDYWLFVLIICSILSSVTLYYEDVIDKSSIEQEKRVQQDINAVDLANESIYKYEQIIISMLKGKVKIDGINRVVCLMRADGSCL